MTALNRSQSQYPHSGWCYCWPVSCSFPGSFARKVSPGLRMDERFTARRIS